MKHHIHCNEHVSSGGGNISIIFCAMHNQQTHIGVLGNLTCCVRVYINAQRPHNQKYEEVDSRYLGQLLHQSKLEEVFGNQVS